MSTLGTLGEMSDTSINSKNTQDQKSAHCQRLNFQSPHKAFFYAVELELSSNEFLQDALSLKENIKPQKFLSLNYSL